MVAFLNDQVEWQCITQATDVVHLQRLTKAKGHGTPENKIDVCK